MLRSCMRQHSGLVLKVFCFLQYYEAARWEEFYIDAVNNFLNCIQLKRDPAPGELGKLSAAREYGLVPCDRISGRMHVVALDTGANF